MSNGEIEIYRKVKVSMHTRRLGRFASFKQAVAVVVPQAPALPRRGRRGTNYISIRHRLCLPLTAAQPHLLTVTSHRLRPLRGGINNSTSACRKKRSERQG